MTAAIYPKTVFWSKEDRAYVAVAPDLPGCSALGDTEAVAVAELDDAIRAWLEAAGKAGNPIPEPSKPSKLVESASEVVAATIDFLNKKYVSQLNQTFSKHFGAQLPEVIWHYTSFEKFEKIARSNEIWSTHVSCLNDQSEVTFAADLSRSVLEAHLQNDQLAPRERYLLESAKTGLLEKNNDSTWFVACFSEMGDDLTQWRAYAENCRGVAIGFDSRELIRFFSNSIEDRPMFCQVCYDVQKVIDFGSKLVALTLMNFRDDFSSVTDNAKATESFLELWGPHIDAFSILPKNPAFVSEKEWRVARQVVSQVGNSNLINFGNRKILRMGRGLQSDSKNAVLPITHVQIGPLASPDTINAVSQMLLETCHRAAQVTKSRIPLQVP